MQDWVARLKASVEVLSADAEGQISHLKSIGLPGIVDDIALDFDDCRHMAKGLNAQGRISDALLGAVIRLDEKLESFSGQSNAHLWTEDALRKADVWKEVRELAEEALRLFEEDNES